MARELWYPITQPTSRGAGFRSAFGGTWPDLEDAPRWCEGMRELGLLRPDEDEQFAFWMEHGYLLLPGAVPGHHVDAFNAVIERMWLARIR